MRPFSFRHKVLLLALALVLAIQIVTFVPVLDAIKRDTDAQAYRSVRLAGVVFDEFIHNRQVQLQTTADVLVSDYGFKKAAAGGDRATIQSALANHAARVNADVALLIDLDGRVISSSFETSADSDGGRSPASRVPMNFGSKSHAVTYIGDIPFETVTVGLRAPVTIARVVLGFRIDESLAAEVQRLTGLQASFVRFGAGRAEPIVSTLPADAEREAIVGLNPAAAGPASDGTYLSLLRPFLDDSAGLDVALQLPLAQAMQSYVKIRSILLAIMGGSLLLAVAGAIWLGGMVTRPVGILARAARRMREGIYTEPVSVPSSDELGELAAGFNAMQQAIADREKHIYQIAHHDSLSGLPNRELILEQLREATDSHASLAVVNLALNRFNRIISSLGHRAADEVIKLVATLLRRRIGPEQSLGHLNRHDFVLILPDCDAERAAEHVKQLTDALRSGVRLGGANVSLQATAGIACYPEHASTPTDLLQCAATARNDAQLKYEPIVAYHAGRQDHAMRQIKIVGDYIAGLKSGEFEVHWQPKIECNNRRIYGAEGLVRWRHPELGLLMPDDFIDAIEQVGGIGRLTRWVLKCAAAQCAAWRDAGWPLSVAVNISVDDLVDQYLPYYLLELVDRHRLQPANITLEVTETAIMRNVQMSLSVVSCIRELGFRVAIDDFGTGQSALAQLKRLPLDELKIDKSFVMNMQSKRDEAIVRAVIELGHQLGLCVVSEGVEERSVLERLRALGCERAQGFYIGRPLPQPDFLVAAKQWALRHTAAAAPERRGGARKGVAGAVV
jgi:diguanylate cyclase (GGDEF)-like protein